MEDLRTVQFLKQGQYTYQYVKRIDFAEIDMKASEDNPARLERRLDEERALRYGVAMEAGTEFPAIMLLNLEQPRGKMKWIVATGMHRIEGARCVNRNHFDAYLVTEADIYRREYVMRFANSVEGRGMMEPEIITQILCLHDQFPSKSLTELAKAQNIKPNTVQNAFNEQKARRRALRFGYSLERAKIPARSTLLLGTIHLDSVFAKAVAAVYEVAGFQSNDVKDMVTDIKRARDETAQLAAVIKHRDLVEKRNLRTKAIHGRTKPTAATRVIGYAKTLNNALKRPLAELHISALVDVPGALTDALFVTDDLMENLKRFKGEIERVQKMSKPPHQDAAE